MRRLYFKFTDGSEQVCAVVRTTQTRPRPLLLDK